MKKLVLKSTLLFIGIFGGLFYFNNLNAEENLVRANELFNANRYDEAIIEAHRVLLSNNSDEMKAQSLYLMGRCYWRQKQYRKGIDVLTQIIEKYPQSERLIPALWLRGYCNSAIKNDKAAIFDFERVLQINPNHKIAADAACRRAFIYHRANLGTLNERIENFKRILKDYPNCEEAKEIKRAYCQLLWLKSEEIKTLESKVEAIKAYQELEEMSKEDPAMRAFAKMNLVALTMECERLQEEQRESGIMNETFIETLKACDSFLKEHVNAPFDTVSTVLLIKGESLYFDGKFNEAIAVFDEIIDRFGKNNICQTQSAFAYYMRGLSYLRLNKRELAKESFFKTLDYPDKANFKGNNVQASALEWIAAISIENNDLTNALECKRLLELRYPNHSETERVISLLERFINRNNKKEELNDDE